MGKGLGFLLVIIVIIVIILLIWWFVWRNNDDCDKKTHKKKKSTKKVKSPKNDREYMERCKALGCKDGRICVLSGFVSITEENFIPPGWAKIESYDITASDEKFFILSSEGVYVCDKNYANLKLHKLDLKYDDGQIYYFDGGLYLVIDGKTYLVTSLPKMTLEESDFDIYSYSANENVRIYVNSNGNVVREKDGKTSDWKQKSGTKIVAIGESEHLVISSGKCRRGSLQYEGDEYAFYDDKMWVVRDGHLYCDNLDTSVVGTRLRYAHGQLWLKVTSRCV